MFTIAICDDEVSICSQLENMILDDAKKFPTEPDVEVYSSGEDLFQDLQQRRRFSDGEEAQPVDLLFLDIGLKALDGICIGRKIREELEDENIQIVYISSKKEYAMELFDNRPMNFLLKPLKRDKINQIIEKAMKLANKGRHVFEFYKGKRHFRIPISQIIYFESNKRKIRLVTEKQEYEFYGKLVDVKNKLGHEFITIHQSHIVHIQYIAMYSYEKITLVSKEELSVSQPYRAAVREALLKKKGGEFCESFQSGNIAVFNE